MLSGSRCEHGFLHGVCVVPECCHFDGMRTWKQQLRSVVRRCLRCNKVMGSGKVHSAQSQRVCQMCRYYKGGDPRSVAK